MAKNKSYLKFEGTLGGLTYFEKDGKSFVKTKSEISKSRIDNDPAFKRTRENMTEFGGCARVTKAFRDAFGGIVLLMADTYFGARMNAVMKRINLLGTGLRGQRNIDLVSNSVLLRGFPFDKENTLSSRFIAPYTVPTFNVDRDVASWTVPVFNTDDYIVPPDGATHFRLVLAAGLVSDYEFVVALKTYEPVDGTQNSIGGVNYSSYLPLGGTLAAPVTLTVDLGIGSAVSASVSAIACIGIIFYQEVDGEYFIFQQGHAMKVAEVV